MVKWGLVPSWAKDASIGNRMINARMETVAEKPAYKRALAVRRCLLPADGYFEWYPRPTKKTTSGQATKQPFFIRPKDGGPLAMAGLYEIWRDPTKDEDADDRFLWTCTVITTDAEDDVGKIHDRMPLMVERDRWAAWLDPRTDKDSVLDLLVPAAPGRLEAYPVSTMVNAVKNNGPELLEPARPLMSDLRSIDTPHGEARLDVRRARTPFVTLLLSHGAGGGTGARDLQALAARLPRQGASVVLLEQPWRVAGRKVATPPPTLDVALVAAARSLRFRTPLVVGGRSAGARSAARSAPGSVRPGVSRSRSRCTRRGDRRSRGSRSCGAPAYPRSSCRASTTPWAGPRSSPTTSSTSTSRWCPAATTGSGSRSRPSSARPTRWRSSWSRRWSGW